MLRDILDAVGFVGLCASMYFMIVIGSAWENKVRCENGYIELCEVEND